MFLIDRPPSSHPTMRPHLTLAAAALLLAACSPKTEAPAAAGATSASAPASATAAACGKVTVANMNWLSAELLAHIDAIVLAKGYGCEVELVVGDTVPTLTAMMEKGQPDVAPEAWVNAVREPLDAAVKAGKLHYAGKAISEGGLEGFWIPKFVADKHPEIKTIDDALKRPDLFPAADAKGKGAVHGCPAGWTCQTTVANAFKAWGAAAKGFVLVDTGSAAGLDGTIAKANERQQAWLGYYWAPTAILGQYAMVKLDAGVPHDPVNWVACNGRADCATPAKNDWPRADVFTLVTERFKAAGGPAYDYLAKRGWSHATVNAQLAWMAGQQASGEAGAKHFLKTQPEVWKAWVTPEAAAKVQASL